MYRKNVSLTHVRQTQNWCFRLAHDLARHEPPMHFGPCRPGLVPAGQVLCFVEFFKRAIVHK